MFLHKILIITSSCFAIPLAYFIYTHTFYIDSIGSISSIIRQHWMQWFLFFMLLGNMICSWIFWWNPIKHSIIHKIDAMFAKLSFLFFPTFILFIHNIDWTHKHLFCQMLYRALYYFIKGARHSFKHWCCFEHIVNHAIFHIIVSCGCIFAFIDGPPSSLMMKTI